MLAKGIVIAVVNNVIDSVRDALNLIGLMIPNIIDLLEYLVENSCEVIIHQIAHTPSVSLSKEILKTSN